jgi:hypothetical protein
MLKIVGKEGLEEDSKSLIGELTLSYFVGMRFPDP